MSIAYLTPDDSPIVWRGPLVQGAIARMLWDVDWGALDVLLIDMPPGDAKKGVAMFKKVDIPVLGLIENMAVFTCPDCKTSHHIFGSGGAARDAKALAIPYLGAAPLHMSIRESGDFGVPTAVEDTDIASVFSALAKSVWTRAQETVERN